MIDWMIAQICFDYIFQTYTIHGTPKDLGVLPWSLVTLFNEAVQTPKPRKVHSGHNDTLLNIAKMRPNLDLKEYPPSLKGKSHY